jgi:hypothetical protein
MQEAAKLGDLLAADRKGTASNAGIGACGKTSDDGFDQEHADRRQNLS